MESVPFTNGIIKIEAGAQFYRIVNYYDTLYEED